MLVVVAVLGRAPAIETDCTVAVTLDLAAHRLHIAFAEAARRWPEIVAAPARVRP